MRKVLFVDRDGTLVESRIGLPMDSLESLRLMPGVIPALARIRAAGYELAIVTNQGGLGTPQHPRDAFERGDRYLTELFASQGIEFAANFVCPHPEQDRCGCRKPAVGLVRDWLSARPIDRERSAMVGDRDTDLEFAANLGIRGFKLGAPGAATWAAVAHALVDRPRVATVKRRTRETDITVSVDLDSEAEPRAKTGLGFFDHMLEQLGKHGGFALDVACTGDLHIDEHHTVEDVALALGQALREALGDKRGIQRYGFMLPMDEADAEVSIDLGGRPFIVFEAQFPRERVGELPTELVPHFFRSLAETLGAAIHVRVRGENAHHMVEVAFKGVARALRQAIVRRGDEL
ncbi:MAG TPA: bifunctional histidinol-phosphatase/imidazoleglycerol-phosphate dehydratase HisB, partial [Gammaproteobacteria bacterium]|nr:bifunctional histidinol-phosphatase/imidazoleglycerol-phosphate dehydratase HisB [Gammaproteobacteria bacterium]